MISEELFSRDGVSANSAQLTQLKALFPNCFDVSGQFLLEKFQSEIAEQADISREFYEMNWLGKSYAKLLRNLPPETLLCEDKNHNAKPENANSQNLLIQGDNLDVLKHLKNAYTNKVKMIYIDPPYNTGSDGFVYQDDCKFTPEQLTVFTKIPKNSIKIPVAGGGTYSPDFAYIVKTKTGEILNFVIEAKGVDGSDNLRKGEERKIKHAERLFAQISKEVKVVFKTQFEGAVS